MDTLWFKVLIGLLIILIPSVFFMIRYRIVPSDKAIVISGKWLGRKNIYTDEDGKKIKIIRGSGVLVLPIIQYAQNISIASNKVFVNLENAHAKNKIPLTVKGVATIKIGANMVDISLAAQNYLSKSTEEMCAEANEVIKSKLNVILKGYNAEDVQANIAKIEKETLKQTQETLEHFGLEIITFSIKDVYDEKGYLAHLNEQDMIRVKTETEQLRIKTEHETQLLKAKAEEEKELERIERKLLVEASKNEEALRLAALKEEQDKAKARAEMAYELEKATADYELALKKAELDRKALENSFEYDKLSAERRSVIYDIETRKKADTQVYVSRKEAEAYEESMKIRTKAELEKLLAITEADSRIKEIESETIEKRGEVAKELYKFDKYLKTIEKSNNPNKFAEELVNNKELLRVDLLKEISEKDGHELSSVLEEITKKITKLKAETKADDIQDVNPEPKVGDSVSDNKDVETKKE